jgi:quinol monooxygenase YgiN
MSQPIVLIAIFDAKPDTADELRERLIELETLSKVEDGCERYELHTDDERPLRFTYVETWSSAAAHAAHDLTDHVQRIIRDIPRLTARPVEIHRLRRLV